MKKIIIDILWWCLNKLDPFEIIKTEVGIQEVSIKISKNFYRKNKWEYFSATIGMWVKDNRTISDIGVWKNGELSAKRLYEIMK